MHTHSYAMGAPKNSPYPLTTLAVEGYCDFPAEVQDKPKPSPRALCVGPDISAGSFVVRPTGNRHQPMEKPGWWNPREEGENPMLKSVTASPTAIASITAESDTQKKVDYLNNRALKVFNNINLTFRDMFHLNSFSTPRYYKELIGAIKNGEYTINEEAAKKADENWKDHVEDPYEYWYDFDAFYGINFTKFPKPDWKGHEKATVELRAEYQRVQDVIAISPAEEALKAVQDFEKWLPSNAPKKQ